jgi:hypothetical protein
MDERRKIMNRLNSILKASGFCLAILLLSTSAFSQEVTKLGKEEVRAMLGNRGVIFVDLQHDGELKIPGAVREDSKNVQSWISKYPTHKTLVFYCA